MAGFEITDSFLKKHEKLLREHDAYTALETVLSSYKSATKNTTPGKCESALDALKLLERRLSAIKTLPKEFAKYKREIENLDFTLRDELAAVATTEFEGHLTDYNEAKSDLDKQVTRFDALKKAIEKHRKKKEDTPAWKKKATEHNGELKSLQKDLNLRLKAVNDRYLAMSGALPAIQKAAGLVPKLDADAKAAVKEAKAAIKQSNETAKEAGMIEIDID